MSQTTKAFSGVKLKVNFTAIPSSTAMSNIASDDNISDTFAKIHHWYVKTNGFQASSSPLVSTSNDGIVTTLPSTTGGFLKNTGTAGGAWTTLGDSDIPNTIVRKTGNNTLSGLFGPTSNNGANLGSNSYRFQNIYGTHLFGTDFNGFTIEKSVPSDAVFTDTVPYVSTMAFPEGGGNGISGISFDDDGGVNISFSKFLTSHPSITIQTDTTSTASPTHGGTFTVVDGVARDTNGHVTNINTKTVTLPAQYSHPTYNTSTNQSSENLSFGSPLKTLYSLNYSNGHVTYLDYRTYKLPTLPTASISQAGIVQLCSTTTSTSTTLAATPSAVKTAYDVGKSAKDYIDFENMVEIVNTTPYTYNNADGSQITISMRFTANAIQDGVTITDMGILINRRYNPDDGSPMPMALTLENYEIDHAQYATEDAGASIVKTTISDNVAENNIITDSGKTATIGIRAIDKFSCGVHARAFVIFTYNGTTYTKYGDVEYNNHRTSFPMQRSTNSGYYFALAFGSMFQSTAPTSDTTWPEYNFQPLYHNPKLYCKPSTGTIYATDLYSVNSSNGNVHLSEGGVRISLPESISTGWNRALTFYTNNESTVLGRYGVYGSSNTLSYYYIGNNYSDTSHLVRVDNDGAGKMTLVGTLPQLKFRQTTSGSGYNNDNAGIKCYPTDNTTGMNMVIQSGGNIIIGGGEFPTNFYNATKFSAESYTDGGEQTYIGSDNNVYVITNGNTIADRRVFEFGSNFNLSAGGKLVFRYGTTYDSLTTHSLTSAATTTARTWTLPDKTGTIALTSDLSSYIPLSGSSSITGNLEITKSSGAVGFYAKRSDTNVRVYFGVGDGGTAEGIYSYTSGGWVFKNDGGNTSIPRITGKSIKIGGITVPTSTGSFLVTGDTSFSSSLTSGTKIGTITIGGTETDLYCQTNTDTKVTNTVGTANTYYPTGLTATATTTGTQVFDTSLKFIGTTGSTSAVGKAQLVLGNATASGKANNKQGSIVVYGSTAHAHTIQGAPTAARTLTLPDKTGTVALTSDIPTAVSFTCTSANTTNYKIDKQRCYCIFGKFVVINMSITTSTTFAANTAYSIATIPSAYTAGSSYIVLGTGHYQVGSPVTPTVSAWINGTSIKFSTTTANSTSSAKTIRVSFTYAMS